MKKILIALAFASLSSVAFAQNKSVETPSKYTVATNSFFSNWYVQGSFDMSLMNPYGAKDWAKNVFHQGKTFGVNIAAGKWFTPGIGLRFKANWENGIIDPHTCDCHDFWGPFTVKASQEGRVNYSAEPVDWAGLFGDVTFNLSNLFCGYNENRVWNLIAYPRAGVVRVFDYNSYSPALGVGIENTWKITKRFGIFMDFTYTMTTRQWREYESYVSEYETYNGNDNGRCNAYLTGELGFQVNLGKSTFSKAVTLEAYNALAAASEEALAKLRAELDKERAENARLRAELAKKPAPGPAPERVVASAATSVFFDLNSTTINSQKDLINLEAVAAVAKETGAKVIVTGSADSQTGSSAWNQKLSEGRAAAAANELVRLGVNRDNITIKAVGGINEVTPYVLNRRAVIELK